MRRLAGPRGRVTTTVAQLEEWKQGAAAKPPAPIPIDAPLRPSRSLRTAKATGGYVLIGLIAVVGLGLFAAHSPLLTTPARLSWRMDRDALIVTDQRGRELWRKEFPYSLLEGARPEFASRYTWVGDLDGDGHQEVLFAPHPLNSHKESSPLICYDDRGRERWRFVNVRRTRSPEMEFTPVYALREFLVSPLAPGKGKAILVTTTHEFYYPAQAALLSPQGKVLREYWHSGHLMFLHAADMDGDGRVEFYLAGINNARHAATLVVLDLDHFAGASQEPQAPDHQLEPFAKGSERARVILPRSCLNRAFSPYNTVVDMVAEDGKITVETAEVLEPISAGIIHHLTPDFRTHQMVLSDAYELAYRRARISGLLQDCNLNDPGLNSLDVLGTPR